MAESSLFWNSPADPLDPPVGDASIAPYDAATEFALVMAALAGPGNGGVFFGQLSDLAASAGAGTVTVQPGVAMVFGNLYLSDSPLGFSYGSGGTVILRKDWTAQTVRMAFITGSPTVDPGNIVEIPLWDVDGAGVLTDVRNHYGPLQVGGGLTPTTVDPRDAAVEGTSEVPADAAHQHATTRHIETYRKITAADVSRSATTLLPDASLAVAIPAASEDYLFEAYIPYIVTGVADLNFDMNGPGTLKYACLGIPNGGTDTVLADSTPFTDALGSDNVEHALIIKGTLRSTSGAGTLSFRWAPSLGGGASAQVMAGASLTVQRTTP